LKSKSACATSALNSSKAAARTMRGMQSLHSWPERAD
jgi:hypothetical protein